MKAPTYPISVRVNRKQIVEFEAFIKQFYPDLDRSKYLRQLIDQDMARHGVQWVQYEYIDNQARQQGKKMTWKSGRPRKTEG